MCSPRHCLAGLAAAALSALPLANAFAQDDDRALAGFQRATAPQVRTAPVDALEWERRLRAADRLGPPPQRPPDVALLAAARAGRWEEALSLLRTGGAHPDARDVVGANALVLAARAGQNELVGELIRRGADIDRTGEDGFTALGAAAFAGHPATVRRLLQAGADPARWGASGQGALHLASAAGRLAVLDELLRQKVDIELLNRQRESALDVAAGAGQIEAMGLLLKAGADQQRAGRR
jgi:hypothetical protein